MGGRLPLGTEGGGIPAAEPRPPGHLEAWDGTTYYGRAQLKAAPFDNVVVGGYIFLAGLSGSAAILASLAEASGRPDLDGIVRRGRLLSLLAPTVGSALLIYDLHTPKRFYNMLRVAKATSPMSIGTWILMGFTVSATVAAAARLAADRWPSLVAARTVGRAAGVSAAVLGAGLSTYTAALLAATSTPLWAAAPRSLAIRFGASAMASAASALSLGEAHAPARAALGGIAAIALATELGATRAAGLAYAAAGVDDALRGPAGVVEKVGATGIGVLVPLALLAWSAFDRRRSSRALDLACVAMLAGGALMRTSILAAGDRSAERPDIAFRFSHPRNLPAPRR